MKLSRASHKAAGHAGQSAGRTAIYRDDQLPASVSERAYAALRAALIDGSYPMGVRLTEEQLVADLGLGRTPVREALKRLEAEMLLRVVSGTGLTVLMPTIEEFDDLCEMRGAVDALAARAAAQRATASQIDALEHTHEWIATSSAAGDAASVVRGNIRFHVQLLEASHNRRLVQMTRPLVDAFQILATRLGHGRTTEMVAEHASILTAIRAHDADAAELAAREHIERAHRFYARRIMDLNLRPKLVQGVHEAAAE